MTSLTQLFTVAEHGHGDCWRTAFACVLDKAHPTDVPDFGYDDETKETRETWFTETWDWLYRNGYELEVIHIKDLDAGHYDNVICERLKNEVCVIDGLSPRVRPNGDPIYHAVVGKNLELVHDPHPARLGIVGRPITAYLLNPI